MAWLPYMLLVAAVLILGEPDKIKPAVNRWTDGFLADTFRPEPITQPTPGNRLNRIAVPGLHNKIERIPPVTAKPAPYEALFELNWLTASGSACFLATILAAIFLGVSPRRFLGIYVATFKQLKFALLTIACMLGLAYLMNYSGMTSTLGLAMAGTGLMFPFFSAVVGWLGVFLTGSDTSANALFGNLQVVTANRLGLNPILTASVNSAAGVMGKMISIQSIAVAVAATGLASSDESKLFRFTIKHSIILMVVMAIISMLFAYAFPQLVPVIGGPE
jgi:lactate permease